MMNDGIPPPIKQHQQGFIDADGNFLDRMQSYERAVICGQIKDNKRQ